METRDLTSLEKQIGYRFKNREPLKEALRHSSYANESADPSVQDNERLEFLGDAVLSLVIGHLLMERFPDIKEGSQPGRRARRHGGGEEEDKPQDSKPQGKRFAMSR